MSAYNTTNHNASFILFRLNFIRNTKKQGVKGQKFPRVNKIETTNPIESN